MKCWNKMHISFSVEMHFQFSAGWYTWWEDKEARVKIIYFLHSLNFWGEKRMHFPRTHYCSLKNISCGGNQLCWLPWYKIWSMTSSVFATLTSFVSWPLNGKFKIVHMWTVCAYDVHTMPIMQYSQYVHSLCIWCAQYTQYVHCTVIPINVQRLFSPFMIKQSLCQTTIIVWDVAHLRQNIFP